MFFKIKDFFGKIFAKLKLTPEIKTQFNSMLRYAVVYFAALFYWEILLISQNGFKDANYYFVLFLPSIAVFLATLNGWCKNKIKYNRLATPIVMLLPYVFYISQLMYYRIFGSYFSISQVGNGADAMKDFGGGLWVVVKASPDWIFLCTIPVLAAIVHALCGAKNSFKGFNLKIRLLSILKCALLWLLAITLLIPFGKGDATPYNAFTSSTTDTDTGANYLGVLTNSIVEMGYWIFGGSGDKKEDIKPVDEYFELPLDTTPNVIDEIDFKYLKTLTDDKGKQELCDYFAGVSGTNKNEYTGKLKDYNLIYICAEAFSSLAIDPVVTPTLYKMSQSGIVLNNYYNSFKNTTTNGEFALATGLWPDVSRIADANSTRGSFVNSKNNLLPFSLANMFEGIGTKTYFFHNYEGYYYQRNKTHANLGYTTLRFMKSKDHIEGMTFTDNWPSSDLELIEQSVEYYLSKGEPFHTYYMTFSGHGPYSAENRVAAKNYKTVSSLLGDRKLSSTSKYYLAANYELEKAMASLLFKLNKAGVLNKTMIVIAGDHYPYYMPDYYANELAGKTMDTTFEKYKSSCIMYCPGMETVTVDAPVCNVDILPTLLNLWGMKYDSRLLAGVDVFAENPHIAMLYNKSFVTEYFKYNAQNGKSEWLPSADNLTEEEKQQHYDYCLEITKSRYAVSLSLMNEDFYRFVMDNIK